MRTPFRLAVAAWALAVVVLSSVLPRVVWAAERVAQVNPPIARKLVPATGAGWAMERVALVIGNSAYKNVSFLPNPGNDARAVGDAFERLGFHVIRLHDAGFAELRQGLRDFTRAAAASEVVVVFYAGHGIEVDRSNYLVPVDAKLAHVDDVTFEAVPLAWAMDAAGRAQGLGMVILDACRDNPFVASMQRTGTTRSVGRGLAKVEPSGATLVAYAAEDGKTAADGDGDHSPYTEALLRYLEEPGLDVGRMFRKVGDAVAAKTGGRQRPVRYGSLPGRDVYLASVPPPPPQGHGASTVGAVAPLPPSGAAARAYEAAERLNTVPAFQAFIERFPDSFEAKLAREHIDKLDRAAEEVENGLKLKYEERRLVQMGLASAGENPEIGGLFGGQTRRALRAWQESKEVAATGFLTREQKEVLVALGRKEEERRQAEAERLKREEEARQAEAERKAREAERLKREEEARQAEAERKAREAERLKREEEARQAEAERLEREAKLKLEREAADSSNLFAAVKAGDVPRVSPLLSAGADVKARNEVGTPLHYAARYGHTETANLLLNLGADINARGRGGWTPLHHAASKGRTKTADLLLDWDADIEALDNRKRTPLHHAASKGRTETADLLLDWNADIEALDNRKRTPLHHAAREDHTETFALLLDSGADIEAQDKKGETPRDVAGIGVSLLLIRD